MSEWQEVLQGLGNTHILLNKFLMEGFCQVDMNIFHQSSNPSGFYWIYLASITNVFLPILKWSKTHWHIYTINKEFLDK